MIDNPNVGWTDPLALRVQAVLDTQVNPGVAAHGGYKFYRSVEATAELERIELVAKQLRDRTVRVR